MHIKGKLKFVLAVFLAFLFFVFCYFFVGQARPAEKIVWGVNFSQKHSELLGLDWRENYSALINDLGVKNIKLAAHWDLIEPGKDDYSFEDLDWQIRTAEEKGINLLLVIGMRTPRWPECHIPQWAEGLGKEEQQAEILAMLETIVLRYRDSQAVSRWQVENEPFFPFGECPWADKDFLKKEVEMVKSLDPRNRQVLISDSGEGSLWIAAARVGDIVGTTMYKKVWVHQFKIYVTYPFPPVFYARKAGIIEKFFNKKVICVEMQAEPWGPLLLYDSPLEEQEKTMNLGQFKKNIEFARRTGLSEFYLWGSEWWYWMKEKQNNSDIWYEAKKLF
jgi:hypothetical protein